VLILCYHLLFDLDVEVELSILVFEQNVYKLKFAVFITCVDVVESQVCIDKLIVYKNE
jgi:hypothetical protein